MFQFSQAGGAIRENRGAAAPTAGNTEYNPMTMSDRALVQKQKDVIKLQDEMLLDIESGVGRLHEKVDYLLSAFPSHLISVL